METQAVGTSLFELKTFNETIRIERLFIVLKDKAKGSLKSIRKGDIFYATFLKYLKQEFGNPNVVTQLNSEPLLAQPQIKVAERTLLKLCHLELKGNNTWLVSMG